MPKTDEEDKDDALTMTDDGRTTDDVYISLSLYLSFDLSLSLSVYIYIMLGSRAPVLL